MTTETKKAPPVEKIRIGSVQIGIWPRQGEKGVFYTAGKPELSYRDGEGQWHNDAGSYSRRDLLNLAKAALLADSAIGKLNHVAKASDGEEEPDVETAI